MVAKTSSEDADCSSDILAIFEMLECIILKSLLIWLIILISLSKDSLLDSKLILMLLYCRVISST